MIVLNDIRIYWDVLADQLIIAKRVENGDDSFMAKIYVNPQASLSDIGVKMIELEGSIKKEMARRKWKTKDLNGCIDQVERPFDEDFGVEVLPKSEEVTDER